MAEFYGAFVLTPMQALVDLQDSLTYNEAQNVAFFKSVVDAFEFVQREATDKSMHATTVPMGENLDEYFQLPGVGILYKVEASESMIQSMREPTRQEAAHRVMSVGSIADMRVREQVAALVHDDFNRTPIVAVTMEQLPEALRSRMQPYAKLDVILENTPHTMRADCSPKYISYESMDLSVGAKSVIHNGFTTEYPQDQKFWDIYKKLWDEKAGLPYMVEQLPSLYSRYRDVYARNVVSDVPQELASARAAVVIWNRIGEMATKNQDWRIETFAQKEGENAALDVINLERGDDAREDL